MPAKTTEQLFATHSQYLDASASEQEDFRNALNEVMPRIYKMGYWREMLVEHTPSHRYTDTRVGVSKILK